MQYFVVFVSPGSAEADNECGGKLDNYLIASCGRNIAVNKLLKSDNSSSS